MSNMRCEACGKSYTKIEFIEYIFTFVPFISGSFLLFSQDSVRLLLDASSRVKFFKIDDVYVTAFLAEAAGVQRTAAASEGFRHPWNKIPYVILQDEKLNVIQEYRNFSVMPHLFENKL